MILFDKKIKFKFLTSFCRGMMEKHQKSSRYCRGRFHKPGFVQSLSVSATLVGVMTLIDILLMKGTQPESHVSKNAILQYIYQNTVIVLAEDFMDHPGTKVGVIVTRTLIVYLMVLAMSIHNVRFLQDINWNFSLSAFETPCLFAIRIICIKLIWDWAIKVLSKNH